VDAYDTILEEMSRRGEFYNLPSSDLDHLSGDAQRVYNWLVVEWIRYMKNLKQDYPYLFSLEMRINPFDEDRSIVVSGANLFNQIFFFALLCMPGHGG